MQTSKLDTELNLITHYKVVKITEKLYLLFLKIFQLTHHFEIKVDTLLMSIGDANNIYHIRYDTRFTPDGKKVFMINEIQSDVNQSIAKSLTKAQQLSGERRLNPFNADLELNLLVGQRGKMLKDLDDALANNEFGRVNAISASMKDINTKLQRLTKTKYLQ